MWMFLLLFTTHLVSQSIDTVKTDANQTTSLLRWCYSSWTAFSLNWMITPMINVLVVGGVNILYVYLYLHQSSSVIIVLQILLAMFKSFWNGLGYQYLNRLVNHHLEVDNLSMNHSSLQLFIRLLNNIVIPCLVVAAINPECFYNLFVAAPAVVTDYQFQNCNRIDTSRTNSCLQYDEVVQVTSFDPPYNYSYQCSSRFITYYAPAFVFLCVVDGMVVPVAQLLIWEVYKFGVDNNKWWSKYVRKATPRIVKTDIIGM